MLARVLVHCQPDWFTESFRAFIDEYKSCLLMLAGYKYITRPGMFPGVERTY